MAGVPTTPAPVSRDRLEGHVRALAFPRGRRVGQPGHALAEAYLALQLRDLGLEPYREGFELRYDAGGQRFTNLVGRIPGREPSEAPLLVGAHYDSALDAPSADDNAAAVAIALEAARCLKARSLRRDVIVALFDAEEPPYFLGPAMGSVRFQEDHASGLDLACAVIMDLVGHDVEAVEPGLEAVFPGVAGLLFVMGSESRARLPAAVRAAADRAKGLSVLAAPNDYVGDMSDHHAFRKAGQPFLFLSCGQGRHYHSPEDTPDWVNFEKVQLVLEFLLELVACLDAPESEEQGPKDTVGFEIEMLERASGLPRRELAGLLGLESLGSRSDLNRVAFVLSRALRVWAH